MIDKIIDHIYLSGASAVLSEGGRKQLATSKISRVLTVSAMPIPDEARLPNIDYAYVYAMDTPAQDLFASEILQSSVAAMEKAVKDKTNILVHCEVGISRSVTVVAAYLMKRFSWSEQKAITHIQQCRPIAQPNEGFMQQLRVFRKMGFSLAESSLAASPDYRQWCIDSGNAPHSGSDPRANAFVKTLDESTTTSGNKFRCARCRQTLFFAEHVMSHTREDGKKCTFGYLIEPMKWMNTGEYQGKVLCPNAKCGEKLGSYSWGGRQCTGEPGLRCKANVQPWVHLHRTKVDEVRPVSGAAPEPSGGKTSPVPKVVISS